MRESQGSKSVVKTLILIYRTLPVVVLLFVESTRDDENRQKGISGVVRGTSSFVEETKGKS